MGNKISLAKACPGSMKAGRCVGRIGARGRGGLGLNSVCTKKMDQQTPPPPPLPTVILWSRGRMVVMAMCLGSYRLRTTVS